MKVSNSKEDILITYSLGSCLGVTLFDPASSVGGMLHSLLPKSNPVNAKKNPHMYVDSGFQSLLQSVLALGANKKRLICKLAGSGVFLDKSGVFKIGERNYTMIRKVLWKNNILIAAEDVGGSIPRTLVLDMATGQTKIRSKNEEFIL